MGGARSGNYFVGEANHFVGGANDGGTMLWAGPCQLEFSCR